MHCSLFDTFEEQVALKQALDVKFHGKIYLKKYAINVKLKIFI